MAKPQDRMAEPEALKTARPAGVKPRRRPATSRGRCKRPSATPHLSLPVTSVR